MLIWFLSISFLLLAAAGWIYAKLWKIGLSARIFFSDKTAYAGGQIILEEIIKNHKKLPLAQVEVGFRVPKGLFFVDAENIVVSDYVYKRDIFSLRGMEMIMRRYSVRCDARGRYPVSQVTLRTGELLHGKGYIWEPGDEMEGQKEELLVYAGYTDVSAIEHFCDNLLGTVESRSSLYEDPFLFSGIRTYQLTDPMNRINWKAMARSGEMMVNTYASVRDLSCMIYLDVADKSIVKEEELVEESIRIAASLCRKMILCSQITGLSVNTDPPAFLEPGRGRELLSRIEYLLTDDFTARGTSDFIKLFDLPPKRQTSPVINIVISKNLRETEFQESNIQGVFVKPVREDGKIASHIFVRS